MGQGESCGRLGMRDSSGNHSDFYTTHTHEAAGDRPRASLPDTFRKSFAVVRLQKLYGPQAASGPVSGFQPFRLSASPLSKSPRRDSTSVADFNDPPTADVTRHELLLPWTCQHTTPPPPQARNKNFNGITVGVNIMTPLRGGF